MLCQRLHHSVEGLHQTRSWNLTAWTVGAPKSGIYPKSIFPKGCWACSMRTVLCMTSDGCGILLTNVGTSLTAWPSRWTPHKMLRMEYCRSGLQTHRGNAIVDTPCQSPSEFAILLPNNSMPVMAPRCSKAYIIQLKACIKPDPGIWQPGQWVHPSVESILKAPFQKGVSSMQHENCSLHDVWWLWPTLDKCGDLFNRMTKQMDTP